MNELIQIKDVFSDENGNRFVAWFSHTDSRHNVALLDRFMDMFGYREDDINELENKLKDAKE